MLRQLAAGKRIRRPSWPPGHYMHLENDVILNHAGERFNVLIGEPVTDYEVYEEPIAYPMGSYLWAHELHRRGHAVFTPPREGVRVLRIAPHAAWEALLWRHRDFVERAWMLG